MTMKWASGARVVLALVVLGTCAGRGQGAEGTSQAGAGAAAAAKVAAFADFDRRARAGEALTVVFFGGSLTWGANATDQLHTSYRARLVQRLEAAYPSARFHGEDAAIGGTGSMLGVFRLERDVMARKPDLVFLDFSANDDIGSADEETLASYESLVRRMVLAGVPVVQVIFPFQWNVTADAKPMPRRTAHQAIAQAYGVPSGDAIGLIAQRLASGASTTAEVWPYDPVHPGDRGYELFTDAAWDALRAGIAGGAVCRAPAAMLHAATCMTWARAPLATLAPLPVGWKAAHPDLVSAFYDMLMSRWQGDQAVAEAAAAPAGAAATSTAAAVAPFTCSVQASTVLIFGESTERSGTYQVQIDGVAQVPPGSKTGADIEAGTFARNAHGNVHHVVVVTTTLDPAQAHRLTIVPHLAAGQELRLESVCVAGGAARVTAP
jgi:lysophospholipase L1-like esterase